MGEGQIILFQGNMDMGTLSFESLNYKSNKKTSLYLDSFTSSG